ncbi:Membrane-spanning 4-domains subfamily A member 4A [Channa argus]|uniref:Membrane-spanning 4-domains subfamily A member 4A n=1 Tax=Channa argus TaxID=215402 RepID=A0A6G1PQ94_CHAAH|nr:Membrane-spanning 4-domains subfamily A member 4A [Channa argus]KAK2909629.1 hypothetical protein Q8A73_007344 [Channa argus]
MTSTSITKVGGITIVTQVIPQEEASIQLQSAATTKQLPAPATNAAAPAPSFAAEKDGIRASFLLGGPQGLGIVQIFVGLLCILFSLTAIVSPILVIHALFSLAILFVLSGSLTLAASRQTSVGLVWASLVFNMIAGLVALAGVTFVCWLLADRPPSKQLCDLYTGEYNVKDCERIWGVNEVLYGLRGLLLVLLVLQVCVSITVCVFSGKAIRRHSHYNPLMVEEK